jgi:hypothetical protein
MHDYQAQHGQLPPAAVCGKDGKPLLSWRVLLLPHIEQGQLYKEFHLDEPWDSPHNIQFLPRMPATYVPPSGKLWKVPEHHTVCKVFVGKHAAFEGTKGLSYPEDFPDGTNNTLLIVEAGEPVPWTKPEELAYDPQGPLPDLRGLFDNGFRAVTADGITRFVQSTVSEATLRAAITRDGGDRLGPDWYGE